jgi:hypothetical protein
MARQSKQSKQKAASRPKKRAPKKSRGKAASANRQTFDWITSSLTSPLVRQAIAAALIAGAGAAAAVFAGQSGRAKKKMKAASSLLSDATQDVTDAAVGALAGVATNAVEKLLPSSSAGGQSSRPGKRDRGEGMAGP